MCRAKDNINDIRVFLENCRQGLNNILDAFVRQKKSKGKQHDLAFHAKLILVEGRVDELHVRHPMRDNVDLLGRNAVNILQQLSPAFSHHDKTVRKRIELIHDESLRLVRFAQHSMQRGHYRHVHVTQQSQQVTSSRSAVNAKLVL